MVFRGGKLGIFDEWWAITEIIVNVSRDNHNVTVPYRLLVYYHFYQLLPFPSFYPP
jgi:hypothetical protein